MRYINLHLHLHYIYIYVTTCLADIGSCTDCQQGGLLQLGSRWYLWPATRPIAVRLECCRPFGFLSEAFRSHNPIAPWAPSAEFWIERVTFRLCVLAYRCFVEQRHLTLLTAFSGHLKSALCCHSHVGRIVHVVWIFRTTDYSYTVDRPFLPWTVRTMDYS